MNESYSTAHPVRRAVIQAAGRAAKTVVNSYVPGLGDVAEAAVDHLGGDHSHLRTKGGRRHAEGKLSHGEASEIEAIPAPVAVDYRVTRSLPKMSSRIGKDGEIIITNSELWLDSVAGYPGYSVGASAKSYYVNPGLASFRWLSVMAANYEKYRWMRLKFHFIPVGATTITAGAVYMAIDYDPDDPIAPDLESLSTYQTFSDGRAYARSSITASARMMHSAVQWKRLRCGPVASTYSLHDGCSLTVAAIGATTDNQVWGQIWVEYEVAFKSPQKSPILPTPVGQTLMVRPSLTDIPTGAAFYFQSDSFTYDGCGIVQRETNTIGGTRNSFILPCAHFEMRVQLEVSAGAISGPFTIELVQFTQIAGTWTEVVIQEWNNLLGSNGERTINISAFVTIEREERFNFKLINNSPSDIAIRPNSLVLWSAL